MSGTEPLNTLRGSTSLPVPTPSGEGDDARVPADDCDTMELYVSKVTVPPSAMQGKSGSSVNRSTL